MANWAVGAALHKRGNARAAVLFRTVGSTQSIEKNIKNQLMNCQGRSRAEPFGTTYVQEEYNSVNCR